MTAWTHSVARGNSHRATSQPVVGSNPTFLAGSTAATKRWKASFSCCEAGFLADVAAGTGLLAQSIPTPPRPPRQTGRHPRGLALTRVRHDLLAHLAEDMGDQSI